MGGWISASGGRSGLEVQGAGHATYIGGEAIRLVTAPRGRQCRGKVVRLGPADLQHCQSSSKSEPSQDTKRNRVASRGRRSEQMLR